MAEPYSKHLAETLERNDPALSRTKLLSTVRNMQVDQLDQLAGGSRAAAILTIATNPTAGDTVGIGDDTFEFVANGGSVSSDGNIAVERGGDAATSVDNLIAAINATDADNQHANITLADGVTPAKANGTTPVVADKTLGATLVRVRAAAKPGGSLRSPGASALDAILVDVLTAVNDGWDAGSGSNMTEQGALASGQLKMGVAKYTATNIAASGRRAFSFPFTITTFQVQVRTAAGVVKYPTGDAWTISGNDVILTANGGGAPNVVDTDVITVVAFG